MHVLHIIDGLGLGGAERMLIDIANATVRDGHRVSVCITRNTTTLRSQLDKSIEVLVLDRRSQLAPSAIIHLSQWIRRERPDVLHVHMRSSMAFIVVVKALGLVRVPTVFHDHYGTIEVDTSVPIWFRLGHRLIDHYVGVYDRLCAWAQEAGVPATRTSTISNAIDLSRLQVGTASTIRTELGISQTEPLGVLVATIRPDKGIEMLVDAVAASRNRDRMRIAIAGGFPDPGYVSTIRARIAERGLEMTITLLGPRDDVPEILAGATFGLLSSHSESGPLVLIEYLVARLPIIATIVGDIGRRLAASGVPGFVPARSLDDFTTALDQVIGLDEDARVQRGDLGRRLMTSDWDIRAVMPRWYETYQAAISN